MKTLSKNENDTAQLARSIAEQCASLADASSAFVIALDGELGAGKTTFVQAFAKELGVKDVVTSPTFVIMKVYKTTHSKMKTLVHVDAYRAKDSEDLAALGLHEYMLDPSTIILIEWADRVVDLLPKKYTRIHIDHIDDHERSILVENIT